MAGLPTRPLCVIFLSDIDDMCSFLWGHLGPLASPVLDLEARL